ncbi:MAG: dephospho-CoA kinase [Verrucomicrobia bacterium]|nr:dephospho-CoA kinase [Verrucomicrobiota bacterium]
MGCGKSSVAKLLEQRGYRRLDSDEIVRSDLLCRPAVMAELRRLFGDGVITAEGRVDRGRLAARVFADEAERQSLEDLVHPLLYAVWRARLDAEPSVHWVFEVPLLFEKGLENWFDFIVCVTTTPAQQYARLEARGITREQAEARISKQLPLARKTEWSDYVIGNEGSPEFLARQVDLLVERLEAEGSLRRR